MLLQRRKGILKLSVERMQLHEVLPLKEPLSLHINPSWFCNFKCNYCYHDLTDLELEQKQFKKQYMNYSMYCSIIDTIYTAGWHLKALIFAGLGEPLLHKNIADMVAYAKEKKIADRVEIVTNGSLLTTSLSNALISAGLDRLRISIQGISDQEYQQMCGVKIDFEKFIQQLSYFYEHKTSTEVYAKIIDTALKESDDREKFEHIFCKVADVISIEYAIPVVNEIDLGVLSGKCKMGHCKKSNICSMPFYMLVIHPNGNVMGCCLLDTPIVLGNVKQQSIVDIWLSGIRKQFLIKLLDGADKIPVCSSCCVPAFGLQEGDYLDEFREELKLRFMAPIEE